MASGFTLATYVQRKMELNNRCSPDLLNVRRQKRLTSLPLNKIMTVSRLTPSIEQQRCIGGADRDRTGDLLLAKQALSQLSYSPI
jgi:hypothetical protein